ncbi:hypothetical protein VNI00_000695 [Paramarasmius palmivorus]|uniref:Fatty acid desaturase domain-containing protein n=1 Tax=Paramarasmius palmivorus TaxID=297713 RepID=A0AAW0E9F2_9AGAR
MVCHEAGHNNISSTTWINHTVGFIAHSMIFLPYFSFKITHLRHHKTTSHLDKEEVYVPYLRSDFPLPSAQEATPKDYMDVFEETPIVTLCLRESILHALTLALTYAFRLLDTYLTWNTMGSKRYPIGSNHWNPKSGLFTNEEYAQVMISNIGMMAMVALLYLTARLSSVSVVVVHYFVPFVLTNHWVVAMTFLQHSCSTVPYYRGEAWSRTKGALSTVDRPFLGYVGKFILLGVNHYHTTHHLFASIPFYNLPMAHAAIRPLLGDMYNYDSTGVFRALWRSFNECIFVESEGAIVFFKDTQGNAKRNVKVLGGDPSRA